MIGLIAKKDFVLNLTSAKVILGFFICLFIIPFTLIVGVDRLKQQQATYKTIAEDAETQFKNVKVLSAIKPTIVHSPEPLSVFSEGVSLNMGTSVQIKYGEYPMMLTGSVNSQSPLLNAFYSIDFATVIAIIMSLLALVFSYDCFTQERENGTLKMIMVNRINRSSFFIGKFFGILLTLIPILLFCFILGALFLVISPDIIVDSHVWTNIILLFLSSTLYVVVFVLFGMFISSMSKRSSTSIILCLLSWVWFLFLMPNIAAYSAKNFVKTELYENMQYALNDIDAEYRKERDDKGRQIQKELGINGIRLWNMNSGADEFFEMYGGPRASIDYFTNFTSWAVPRIIEYSDKKWTIQKNYLDGLVKQEKFQQRLSLLSPSEIFGQLASSLCYTDPNYYLTYMDRVREYRLTFIQYIKDNKFHESSKWATQQDPETFATDEEYAEINRILWTTKSDEEYKQFASTIPKEWDMNYYSPLNLDNVPVFDYKPHATGAYNFALMRIAMLLAIALILLMLTMLRFRKYQI